MKVIHAYQVKSLILLIYIIVFAFNFVARNLVSIEFV